LSGAAPQVIHEDASLLAVAKPAGQAVIPGRGLGEEPLSLQASRRLGGKAFIVHRIDRDASGLVIFAKDAAAHRELCALFEGRLMSKAYLALVQGRVDVDGTVDRPIREFGSGRSGACPAGAGKESVTSYRVRARGEPASLLEVEPETGRRHQIRVHLYSAGHPLMGDRLYGKDRPVGGVERLMLHAWKLEFDFRGQPYRLCCPPEDDFLQVLGRYGLFL
jgi:RluA family pseudouridine synthase